LLISCSIALAAIPAQVPPPQVGKTSCCAKMKAQTPSKECDRHAPKSGQEQQNCAACAFGLAVVVSFAAPFVYPPIGDQSFAAYISSEHARSDRPPVPPPRA
jgi:hypothetical protein